MKIVYLYDLPHETQFWVANIQNSVSMEMQGNGRKTAPSIPLISSNYYRISCILHMPIEGLLFANDLVVSSFTPNSLQKIIHQVLRRMQHEYVKTAILKRRQIEEILNVEYVQAKQR
jgi:hypothetical protein